MGVVVVLVAADDTTIDRLVANPEDFGRFMIGGDLVFENTEEKTNYFRNGILPQSLRNATRPETTDMDKAWAAIDFVLRKFGDQDLWFIKDGGRDIREIPKKRKQAPWLLARAFSSIDVERLNRALSSISSQQFLDLVDVKELHERDVYPFGFADVDQEYVLHWFVNVKAFVAKRAENHEGMMVTES